MARKIKFALEMADGTFVSNLEYLQKHIKNNDDVKKLVEYFLDGRLEKWLLDRYYEEEANALQSVDKDDPDFTFKFCKAISLDYTPSESINVALIEYEKRMRKALEEVTLDSELLANADCTASNQSDLDFLIKNGKKIIYLWGDSFKLPLVHNISYIGILGTPSVDIGLIRLIILPNGKVFSTPLVDIALVDLEAIESYYGIKFENLNLPEKFNFKSIEVFDKVSILDYEKKQQIFVEQFRIIAKVERILDEKAREIVKKAENTAEAAREAAEAARKDYEFAKFEIEEYNRKYRRAEKEISEVERQDYEEAEKIIQDYKKVEYAAYEAIYEAECIAEAERGAELDSRRVEEAIEAYETAKDKSEAISYKAKCIAEVKRRAEEDAIRKVEEEIRKRQLKNANIGDFVKFGSYPQTVSGASLPIEWLVLAKENNKILVISRYGLEARCYYCCYDSSSSNWKNSEIRQWLNNDFYNEAFSNIDKKNINFSYLSDVGTADNIFLLSADKNGNGEANKYFADNESRRCKATEYARYYCIGDVCEKGCGWWLRSPYPDNSGFHVYCVDCDGDILYDICSDYRYVVRPALWINF